jgi:16S rRNA (cytosine967-C5)-methyltransferase
MNIKLHGIALLDTFEKGQYSNIALDKYIKSNDISPKEKAFLTEIFYGVIRNLIFIDYQIDKRAKKIKKQWIRNILRISIYQCTFMDSDKKGVIWEAVELSKEKYGAVVSKFVNGVLRTYDREMEKELKELKEKKSYEILYSYPKWFVEKIKEEYKERTEEILKSLKTVPYMSYRVNNLKYSEERFEKLIKANRCKIVKKVGRVYYLQGKSLVDTVEFEKGLFTVQDASSFLASTLLNPVEGDTVLDSCSAPGGKSTAMAENMNNKGKIVSLDIHKHKIKLIKENAKKLGIDIIETKLFDATKANELDYSFDKILVDAPCTGLGVIRKKPETVYGKDMKNVRELSELQYSILSSAAQKLKKGGSLVYSTCTILKEENRDNVERFLNEYNNFEVEEISMPENIDFVRDQFGGLTIIDPVLDGFYIAKLKKVKD